MTGSDSVRDARARIDVLDRIAANQWEFDRTRSLRRRYLICLENEALFARLGIHLPPLQLRGIAGWWLRRYAKRHSPAAGES